MKAVSRQKGQGMTEYIIIVALIAIAAIGVYTAFGKTVRGQMAATAQALAGNVSGEARAAVNESGDEATEQAQRGIQLDNYDQPQ